MLEITVEQLLQLFVATNAAWSNLGPASTSPWSNAAPPMPSYYQLRLAQ